MKNNTFGKSKTIVWLITLAIAGLLALSIVPEYGLNMNVNAETWTETTTDDFTAGETAFIDIENGTLQLARGLNRLWYGLGEAANDRFGYSVSSAGDVNGDGYDDIIVGAYYNDGAGSNAGEVYMYYGSASGPSAAPDWSDQGEAAFDYFGCSVSGAGDVNGDGYDDIIVGAYRNDGAGSDAGEAYVYYGSASGPSAAPDWSDQGEAAFDYFGYSVSGAGDVNGDGYDDIIVGAYGNDGAGSTAGEAYVYYGSASGPSAAPDWSDQGEAASDYFGWSVSGAGDVNGDGYDDIIVGAYYNDGAGSNAGEAYVYYGSASGPSATPDWYDQGEAASDYFGWSVSGAGDVNGDGYDDIIVGACYNDGAGSNAGEAYVYYGSASGPNAAPDWSDQGEAASDNFGRSVSGADDVNGDGYDDIIVGAYGNDGAGSTAGEAYVYYGSASGPSAAPDWSDQGEAASDYFGWSVSGAGDVNGDGYDDIIVGAYNNDDSASNAGKAYLFGIPSELIFQSWSDQGEAAFDHFGRSVSSAGDVNGDGYDDMIVGAYGNDGAGSDAGEAYVYYGSASGPSATPDWSDQGEASWDCFGSSVSCAGDVNGDGYDDILVGAYGNDGAGSIAGEAYVYYGSASGPSATPDWSDQGEAANDYFGNSVSCAGDVNGDGYDDIIVGAHNNDGAGSNAGEAYVYYGSASGPSATPDWSDQGEALSDYFGYSVSSAGDVNGDGYDDIIVGAHNNDGAGSNAGEAYVYYGSASGLSAGPDWSDQGEAAGDYFGISVSGAGDVNGDGYDDIIVGANNNDGAGSQAGEAYVYYGSASGPSATPDWSDQGEAASDYFGYFVSCAGDVNGDGYDDIIVGAYGNDGAGSNAGEAYVYYGSASGPNAAPDWSDQGEAAGDNFGYSVSGAGDVNGDGYDDIIVGARNNDGAGGDAGEAYVYTTAQYAERGRFISDTFSVEGYDNFNWFSIDWKPFIQPDGTSVRFQIATNDDGYTWNFVGPDGTEDTFFTNPHGQGIDSSQLGSFIKVRIYLSTTVGSRTPAVDEFSVNYKMLQYPLAVLTSPNGGEDWMKSDWYPITWNAEGNFNSTPVCLYYSTDNGASWTVIDEWIENTGYYNWTVPNVNTPSALIKVMVTDISGKEAQDTSDASFAIDPPPPSWSGSSGIGIDTTLPVIEHTPPTLLEGGKIQSIIANVQDNLGVNEVILIYRYSETDNYQQISMINNGEQYIASFEIENIDGTMYYYIQASDGTNTVATNEYSVTIKSTDIQPSVEDDYGVEDDDEAYEFTSSSILNFVLVLLIVIIIFLLIPKLFMKNAQEQKKVKTKSKGKKK